jgi:hypothetical protein
MAGPHQKSSGLSCADLDGFRGSGGGTLRKSGNSVNIDCRLTATSARRTLRSDRSTQSRKGAEERKARKSTARNCNTRRDTGTTSCFSQSAGIRHFPDSLCVAPRLCVSASKMTKCVVRAATAFDVEAAMRNRLRTGCVAPEDTRDDHRSRCGVATENPLPRFVERAASTSAGACGGIRSRGIPSGILFDTASRGTVL